MDSTENSETKCEHSQKKDLPSSAISVELNQSISTENATSGAKTLGFIGAGNMAQALINGFVSKGLVDPINLLVSAISDKNLSRLREIGIKTTHNNTEVVVKSDVVFLAVKPNIIPIVLKCLEGFAYRHNTLFISVASGVSTEKLEEMLQPTFSSPRVIRVMPNTPCMVFQGCSVFSLGSNVGSLESDFVKELFNAVGFCEQVSENQMNAACGLAGSGPAYIYAAIEALADGGVKMGLPRSLALNMAAQTVKGAACMVLESGKHPGQLKDEVCSPAGTTITAMHALEKFAFRNSLISAVEASANRSKELG